MNSKLSPKQAKEILTLLKQAGPGGMASIMPPTPQNGPGLHTNYPTPMNAWPKAKPVQAAPAPTPAPVQPAGKSLGGQPIVSGKTTPPGARSLAGQPMMSAVNPGTSPAAGGNNGGGLGSFIKNNPGMSAGAAAGVIGGPVGMALGGAGGAIYDQFTQPDSMLGKAVDSARTFASNMWGDGSYVPSDTRALDQKLNAKYNQSLANSKAVAGGMPSLTSDQLRQGRMNIDNAAGSGSTPALTPGLFGQDNTLAGAGGRIDQAQMQNRSNAYGVAIGEPGTHGLVRNPSTGKMVASAPATPTGPMPSPQTMVAHAPQQAAPPAAPHPAIAASQPTGPSFSGAITDQERQMLRKLHASNFNPNSKVDMQRLSELRAAGKELGGYGDFKNLRNLAYANQYGANSDYGRLAAKFRDGRAQQLAQAHGMPIKSGSEYTVLTRRNTGITTTNGNIWINPADYEWLSKTASYEDVSWEDYCNLDPDDEPQSIASFFSEK